MYKALKETWVLFVIYSYHIVAASEDIWPIRKEDRENSFYFFLCYCVIKTQGGRYEHAC